MMLLVAAAAPGPAWAQNQNRWAAVDPNSETSSPVVWGATEDEASQRAIEACKKLSKTCANGPAVTEDLREMFAFVCCEKPRAGCAVSTGNNRRDAAKGARDMFTEAGYTECSVRHYLSARTGKRQ
jgi:hypothetical protein